MQRYLASGLSTSLMKQHKLMTLTVALLSVGIVSGCSSTPQKEQATTTRITKHKTIHLKAGSDSPILDANSIDSMESLLDASDMAAVEDNKLAIMKYGDVWRRIRSGYKMNLDVSNSRIDAQRSWFMTRQPYLDRLSARASRYLYYTVKEAERRGIPTELALLPVIESSYDPSANSNASAVGLWQFIPSTGTIYGLRQSSLYDGRRDVVESTRAAYDFLTNLYNQFGSWELALAAYNAGPGRIQQAINRNAAAGLPTDYWSLRLPTETMNYVPRFMAVAQIVRAPEQYGLALRSIANRPHFREIQLPGPVDLNTAASIAGLSLNELYALNPGFISAYTDPMGPSRLLVPAELDARADDRLRHMPTLAQTNPALLASMPVGGAVILSGGSSSYSNQQAASFMNGGSSRRPVTSSTGATTVSTTVRSPNTGLIASTATAAIAHAATPTSASALAAFANAANVPSSPRIPVSISPDSSVKKPVGEPPVSAAELKVINALDASLKQPDKQPEVVANVAPPQEPQPTAQEKQQVIKELQAIAPQGTQVVDPLDGKIQLTAIQTSQSVVDAKGEELKINYQQPGLAAQNNAPATVKVKKPVITAAAPVKEKPKGDRSVYVVQPGDTLALIASRHGLNWRDVADWNQIDPNKALFKGSSIYLYGAKNLAPAAKPTSYTVQSGDTLTAVATRFGLTPKQLADMNDLKPTSNLLRGTHLALVGGKGSDNSDDSSDDIPTVNYKVKRGEYLKLIAERYSMTPSDLADLNDLKPNSELAVGQVLQVPAQKAKADKSDSSDDRVSARQSSKAGTSVYIVKSGDTLSKIADKFDADNADIAKLNKISASANVIVGQKLIVPGTAASSKDDSSSDDSTASKANTYRVKSGDTLSSVADKFDMTPRELAKLNDMKPGDSLDKGDMLTVKASSTKAKKKSNDDDEVSTVRVSASRGGAGSEEYTVKRGESLNAIADKYDMSAAELARLNHISAKSQLEKGQTINVPKLTISYKVKRGDTLNRLANKYGISVNELAKMNKMSPGDDLQLGDTVVVPSNSNRSL